MPIEDTWFGCYQESLKGWIEPRAFTHPAKVSLALAKRIYAHAIDEGWLTPGRDLCVDPMAGVGVFGLVAASYGIPWLGIELEEHFCRYGQANIARHTREWLTLGKPLPLLIQGDARNLRALVGEGGLILSSPPYACGCRQAGGVDPHPEHIQGGKNGHVLRGYSQPQAIVSSPPYANSVNAESCGIDWTKMGPATGKRKRGPGTKHHETLTAQLAYQPQIVVSSPPYADAQGCGQIGSMRSGNLDEVLKCTSPCTIPALDVEAKNIEWPSNADAATTPSFRESTHGPINDGSRPAMPTLEKTTTNGQEETKTIEVRDGQESVGQSKSNVEMPVNAVKLQDGLKSTTLNQKTKLEEFGTIATQISSSSVERAITSGITTNNIKQTTSRKIRPPTISILEKLKASQQTWAEHGNKRKTSYIAPKRSSSRSNREGSLAAIITSPPFSRQMNNGGDTPAAQGEGPLSRKGAGQCRTNGFGNSAGRIGQESEPTYWTSMKTIYEACHAILPPQGHLILVLKGFVRKGLYVDLPAQTAELLEHVGFTVLHVHRAMLTSQVGQLTLDGGEERKSRKSFFRRLSENRGSPKIDFETVLCATHEHLVRRERTHDH